MKKRITYLFPLFPGICLLFIPLVRDFHFESAMLLGIIGCFWSGISFSRTSYRTAFEKLTPVFRFVFLAGLPPFLFSLFSGCLTLHGIGFWILTPVPSILLGAAIGHFMKEFRIPQPTFITLIVLIAIAAGGFLIEFFTLPQVYFFNHVWGTWPGPIYDEAVKVTSSYFTFRLMTLSWALLLWAIPGLMLNRIKKAGVGVSVLFLLYAYTHLSALGIISPREHLKAVLGNHEHTEHFEIYYDSDRFSEDEIRYWALKHEFHFKQITEQLEIDWPEGRKIESYLYSDPWQKKKLVGAKFTSYVPIWLEQDQLHIARQHLEAVLKHELVHVISKQFGNDLFNGTWSIGLIEGLAEGIAKDASSESTLGQIMASNKPYPTPEQIRNALSLSGFYSSAGSVSYTTAGSFVSYLLENYPVQNFKEAYPKGDFEAGYSESMEELVNGWLSSLPEIGTDSVDERISENIFSQRSIFQKPCPHSVSPALELWDQFSFHEASEDDSAAFTALDRLFEMQPENLLIRREWLEYQLGRGEYREALEQVGELDSLPVFALLKADILFMSRQREAAYTVLDSLDESDPDLKNSLDVRRNSTNWLLYFVLRYNEGGLPLDPDAEIYTDISTLNLLVAARNQISNEEFYSFPELTSYILSRPFEPDQFTIYERITDQLIYQRRLELAGAYINTLSAQDLRARYQERLREQKEWLEFLSLIY